MKLFQVHYPKSPRNFTFTSLKDKKSKKVEVKIDTLTLLDLICCEANSAWTTAGHRGENTEDMVDLTSFALC